MIGIDRRKPQRLTGTYRDYARSGVTSVNYQLSLDHADLTALVSMGPSVRHITPQVLAARISFLPSPFTVTVDLRIRVFQRPRDPAGGENYLRKAVTHAGAAPRLQVAGDGGPRKFGGPPHTAWLRYRWKAGAMDFTLGSLAWLMNGRPSSCSLVLNSE
jgi:hypothetical protein